MPAAAATMTLARIRVDGHGDRRHPDDTTVAAALVAGYHDGTRAMVRTRTRLPSPPRVRALLCELRDMLFPGLSGVQHLTTVASFEAQVEARLMRIRVGLSEQVFLGLHQGCKVAAHSCSACATRAAAVVAGLIRSLPGLQRTLVTDVQAALDGDPAATTAEEVAHCYPGVQAICIFRIAHKLLELGALVIPRMMTEIAHSEYGIDIHPGASIGESFFIDHGTGVVIGETTVIGDRVRVYQGVTLGALSVPTSRVRDLARVRRHPTLEDDVIVYANATILGGETVIGRGSVVGGNTWVTRSVPARVSVRAVTP